MKRLLGIGLLCVFGCYAYSAAVDALLQQTKDAFFTMHTIGKQLAKYRDLHHRFPRQVADPDFALSMVGLKAPLSKHWDYFYQCTSKNCTITAERVKKLAPLADITKRTLILQMLFFYGKQLPPAIAQVRGETTFTKGTNGFAWEVTSPVDEETCERLQGKTNNHSDCVIQYTK